MKIRRVREKAIEYMPVARGGTNWAMRGVKAIANISVKGGGSIVPVAGQVVAIAGIPFAIFEILFLFKEAVHMKGRAKLIPILMGLGKGDDIVFGISVIKDLIGNAVSKGASLTTAFTTATTVMNVAAVGLIAITIAMESIGLYSLSKQKRKYYGLKESQGEDAAMTYLTKSRETMKGKRRIFTVLSGKQSNLITDLFSKQISTEKKETVVNRIERRFSHLKKTKAFGIAIATLAILGVLLLTFLPTPLAPIGWAALGLSGILAISRVIHYFVARHKFHQYLRQEIASAEK
ncbi:MAG: hypothetical protein ACK5MA_05355 [Parachlamydiaceae bacterium]